MVSMTPKALSWYINIGNMSPQKVIDFFNGPNFKAVEVSIWLK